MKEMFKHAFDNIHASRDLVVKTKSNVMDAMVRPRHHSGHTKWILVCSLIILLSGIGYWLWFIPVVTISVDINPSIELSINRLDRVIDVKAYNTDGQTIIDTLDIKYDTYTQALNELMDDATIQSLMENDGIANITVVGNDANHCQHMVNTITTTVDCGGPMHCQHGSSSSLSNAHHHGMSYGRYALYQLLLEYYPNLTSDEVNNMSVAEIMELLSDAGYDGFTNASNGYGHHHRYGRQ